MSRMLSREAALPACRARAGPFQKPTTSKPVSQHFIRLYDTNNLQNIYKMNNLRSPFVSSPPTRPTCTSIVFSFVLRMLLNWMVYWSIPTDTAIIQSAALGSVRFLALNLDPRTNDGKTLTTHIFVSNVRWQLRRDFTITRSVKPSTTRTPITHDALIMKYRFMPNSCGAIVHKPFAVTLRAQGITLLTPSLVVSNGLIEPNFQATDGTNG